MTNVIPKIKTIIAALLLVSTLFSSLISQAANSTDTPARLWNLQDADILSVINEVSQETGKNFIVDPRVNGKITLISSKPLQRGELYDVFLSVLGMLGYSAIPSGEIVKIVPDMTSGELNTAVASSKHPGAGDEVVVRVIPLSNVSATQMIPVLRPLLPQWSNISSYTPGNILILLGRAANIDRLLKVIQEIDEAANNDIQVVTLKYASAAQIATVLNNLQTGVRGTGETSNVSIAVDERNNNLLLSGPKAARMHMRVLISQLDTPSSSSAGNTDVVYLRYLQAKDFAPLLGKIAQNILGKGESAQAGSGGPSSRIGPSSVAFSNMMGGRSLRNAGSTVSSAGHSEEPVVINSGYIQAEVNTNSLIITAPPALMKALKAVVAKLDIRPAQVLVEAIIAEVDESNLASLGVQWGGIGAAAGGSSTSFMPLGPGVFGGEPTIHLGLLHLQIQDVLSLLRNQSGVDILATPSIMVLDNQNAAIEIGQQIPTENGSYASTAGSNTVAPFNTIEYKDVTLKLDVTPQVNLKESVRLKLKLKNDTLQNPQNPGKNPPINKSSIENSVLINSNDILVLGGLISNSNNESVNKIPILGDLPFFGPLFQQKTSNQQKRNLVVFIKPTIVTNANDATTITYDKYMNLRSIQANFKDNLRTIGDEPAPTALPPWQHTQDLPTPFEQSHD